MPCSLREHGHRVGADLVGDVAVGGDAIGADDDEVDLAGRMIAPAMLSVITVVSMPSLHQLPRGQPRALQKRPRLVGEARAMRLPASTAPRITPSAVP